MNFHELGVRVYNFDFSCESIVKFSSCAYIDIKLIVIPTTKRKVYIYTRTYLCKCATHTCTHIYSFRIILHLCVCVCVCGECGLAQKHTCNYL